MTKKHPINRLQKQLAHLISLEAVIEQRLEELLLEVSDHAETTIMLSRFLDLPRNQRLVLHHTGR